MRIKHLVAAVLASSALAWAPTAFSGEVIVSAASSLTNAFKELAVQFHSTHSDIDVLMSFGASDVVLQQILNGAPTDIFASADEKAMDKAVAANVVDPLTRTDFAKNEVVMIVPVDSKLDIGSTRDLARADIRRIAVGNPASVPVGRYTRLALSGINAWDSLQPKMIVTQNVRQALDYVARGEVDAGFVFATDAAIMPNEVKVVQHVVSPVPVVYSMALTRRKKSNPEARLFMEFVLSSQGQGTLAGYGFSRASRPH